MGKDPNPTTSTSTRPKLARPRRCGPTPEIKARCEQWMATRQRGNDTKSPPSMREKQPKNGDSALVHQVHAKLTALIEDSAAKQKHIKSAIELAQRATELAPNSTELAYFYASLMFDYMAEKEACELPLAECESALSVHRVHRIVHQKLTALIKDSAMKKKHIKSAIESAQKATELPPNSTELAHFYASLLFDYMAENEACELPLAECESALSVHRVHGIVHGKLTALIEESAMKQRLIKSAIGSAEWVTQLDPNSIEFVHFLASLLFDYMAENEAHESALDELERTLSEESPVDCSEETTISQVQGELKNLAEQCNLASISTRVKALCEQKCNVNPVRGINEQVENRVLTGRTAPLPSINNEITKTSKISDERRKEIDVCVAATLLLQQQHAEKNNMILVHDINEQVENRVPTGPSVSINNEITKAFKVLDERRKEIDVCLAATLLLQLQDAEKSNVIPVRGINEQVENRVPTSPTASLPNINNDIKKASKILDEHRKEFDVCLAATLLLQQQHADPGQSLPTKSASSWSHSEEEHFPTASPSSPSSGFHCQKPISCKPVSIFFSNRMNQVQAYWNSMTAKRQLSLLRTSIPELKSHYARIKEFAVLDLLSEALSFAEESGSWEFWICFKCNKKFSDAVSHLNHVSAHIGMMSDLAMEAIPKEVTPDWVDMLTNTSLKPIDVESVMRSSDEASNRNCNLMKDTDSGNSNYASSVNCLEREVKENGDCNGFEKMKVNCGDDAGGRLHKWLSDDPEREKLLEKIMSMFCLMIKHRCLSTRHVRKLLEFINHQIKAYPLPSNVLAFCGEALETTPLGLCFLDASELRVVLTHLEELFHTGLQRSPAKDASTGVADGATKNGDDVEIIKLDIMSSTLTVEGFEDERGLRDANALFQWIYAGPTIANRLAVWADNMEEKSNQVIVLVKTLEKELSLCQTLCEKKLEYLETLHMLELLENLREEKGLGCEEFLKNRYDELMERKGEELLTGSSQDQIDLIRSLVKEAYQQFKLHNIVFENGIGSRLQDMEAGNVDECRKQDLGPAGDDLISDVLSSKKDNLNKEINKLDVRIMRGVRRMRLLELKLGRASSFDYRFVLIPVIKSFVQTHLEELVDEYTKDRCDAAREALLSVQAKDEKYNLKGESKQSNGKTKSPKGSSKDNVIHEEITEKSEVVLGDNMDGVRTDEALNQDEEETNLIVGIEAEERILQETLEYQRGLEERKLQKTLENQTRMEVEAKKGEHDMKSQFKAVVQLYCQNDPWRYNTSDISHGVL